MLCIDQPSLCAIDPEADVKRIMFVTGHYYRSNRRGGIHWLAKAFHRAGWDVLFFTSGLSYFSRIIKDHRFQYPVMAEANRILRIEERFSSFVWFTPWHPVKFQFKLANRLAAPLFARYGNLSLFEAENAIRRMDVIMIEGGAGLVLVDRLKRINPSARFVYRVSDDLEALNISPVIIEAERRYAPDFDLITAPSSRLLGKFRHLSNTAIHPQGLAKELFDREHRNPYKDSSVPNLISIGNMIYDLDFLKRASRIFPDWRFHIIGWLEKVPQNSNVIFYGEKPFEQAVAFMKYADIGLSPYQYRPGNEYLSDASHKMLQYTYCRLPVVAPNFVTDPSKPHVIGYEPGEDDSIRNALERAIAIEHETIDPSPVRTWDEIVQEMSAAIDTRFEIRKHEAHEKHEKHETRES